MVASRIASRRQEASVAFADILDEAFVGLSDAALETHLAERASRLGRQIHYRIQMRSIEHVGMLVEAGIGIAILSEASARTLRRPEARDRAAVGTLGRETAASLRTRLRRADAARGFARAAAVASLKATVCV